MSNKMKTTRTALLTLLVALISLSVSAQNVTVKGTVKDKTGETVIGASVVEKGNTSNGTITDIDGNYTISVPANARQHRKHLSKERHRSTSSWKMTPKL